MKKSTILISLIILSTLALAQKPELPLGNNGKITFHGVVETPGLPQETLHQNALGFLAEIKVVNQKKKEDYLTEEDEKVTSIGGFLVYNYKSPDGEIRYTITIEVKDNKYRYTITDFVFYPYTRNRYGRFEREKWQFKSLDEPVHKSNQKSWEKHKAKTGDKMERLISSMSLEMERLPIVAEESKSSSDSDW